MNLREYLARHRIKIAHLAKKLNYDRRYLGRIVNGYRPGKSLAVLIEQFTNGEVTAKELLSSDKEGHTH